MSSFFAFLPPQHRRQQQELLKLQQQQALQLAQQPQAKLSGWGSVAKQPAITKSLLEIQREEAQQMKQRKDQQQQPQQHPIVTQQIRTQTRTVRDLYDTVFYLLKGDENYIELRIWVWILSGFSTTATFWQWKRYNIDLQKIVWRSFFNLKLKAQFLRAVNKPQ